MVSRICRHSMSAFTDHAQGDMVFGGANSADMMNNGDPSKVIMGGKKAVALLDRYINSTDTATQNSPSELVWAKFLGFST